MNIPKMVLAAALLASCSPWNTGSKSGNNPPLASPEAVTRYFVESLKEGNFENALKTCVMSNQRAAAKLNQKEMLKSWDVISAKIFDPVFLPSGYGPLVTARDISNFAYEIRMLIGSLLLTDEFTDLLYKTDIPLFGNEAIIDRYFSLLHPGNLGTLELVRIDPVKPEDRLAGDPGFFADYLDRAKRLLGLDEILEYTALYKLNQKYFQGEFQIYRYGNDYLINALTSGQRYNEYQMNPYLSAGAALPVSGIWEYLELNRLQQ